MLDVITDIAAAVAFLCIGMIVLAAVIVPFVAGWFVRRP
jgi:hypothetical protein